MSVYYITKPPKYLEPRKAWETTYAEALPFLTIIW